MKIEHISVSRQSLWTECQQRYKYKYHLEVITDVPTPFYFTFGKLMHKIIEEHTRSKGEKSLSRVKSEVLSGQIELEPGQKAPSLDNEYHNKLALHLRNYQRLADKIGFDGEVEWAFKYDLDPPNQRLIVGFIDRLILKNDTAFIIDYKTTKPSKWRKDHKTITKDLQLACYCHIINKTFGIPSKNIKAALYYLEDAKLVPVSFCEETLNNVPRRLTEVYKEIQAADPDRVVGKVGDHCRRCDFRKLCPFYSLT